jgi:hypothetical protein
MRILIGICVAALLVAFAVPAFAETQNIKVSGDIKTAYVYQSDIDLKNNDDNNQNFFISQIGLNVEADLTDNVSTYIRLLNERDWNATTDDSNQFDILLDEAYLTMKEVLYAPLTLQIGRQNIWLGKGLVIGNAGPKVWDEGGLPVTIRELSDITAFDSIRATLDYDPWTIDLIYAKIDEKTNNATGDNHDDVDLYVANIGYDFTKYDAESELYYIYKHDRATTSTKGDPNTINTIGLRGSLVPFDNANLWAEGAYQFGHYRYLLRSDDREAGAVDVGADFTFVDTKWTPMLGAEYIWLSGEKSANTGKWKAWDSLYRGKFDNYLADFRNITKNTQYADDGNTLADDDSGMTNQNSIALFASIEPMTDISLDARWTYLWYDEVPVLGNNKEIGHELDATFSYDYTEDVEFTVAAGLLWPLDYYTSDYDSAATQIVAATTVDF